MPRDPAEVERRELAKLARLLFEEMGLSHDRERRHLQLKLMDEDELKVFAVRLLAIGDQLRAAIKDRKRG